MNYYPGEIPVEARTDPSRGLISRYAWGADYHDLMAPRLEELAASIRAETGGRAADRIYVDTGPVLERAYAAAAGLGFIGKNTCMIHPRFGSWLFLGEILLDVDVGRDVIPSYKGGGCGTCTRCLEACPTGALVAPYVLDARRCISYLTIELKGAIPGELRPLLGNRIYGCDVCQEVCPWQRFARPTQERAFRAADPDRAAPPLLALIALDEEGFRRRYTGSPIARIGRGRFLRNVAVALGNWGDRQAIPALEKALTDADPLMREHAAWALERINGRESTR
jgi:epoxyqueuosine reductase